MIRKHPLGLIALSFLFGYLALAQPAQAQQYNRFGPATGVLVGNVSTPQTTAATSANIIGLWTGTCNASTFMKGDGSCAVPTGTGVTSVGLTMPSGLSVAGSPVTSSGTLAVTTTLSGVVKANGSGFTASAVGLATADVTGTLPVANGGTGAVTITGPVKGNGTSAFTAATSADIIGLWTGTCNSSTFLRADGSCQVAGGGTSPANPSGLIGMTAVNGVAATFDRSDSTHAIDPAIAPTWTGQHIFNNNGVGFEVQRSTNPSFAVYESGATVDNRRYQFLASGEQLQLRLANDAASLAASWLTLDRTLNVADLLALNATTINLNGVTNVGLAGANGNLIVSNSTTSAGNELFILNGTAAGAHSNTYIDVRRNAVSYAQIRGDGTSMTLNGAWQVNGVTIAPYVSGTYTGTITGCTTSPTLTIGYTKIADVVTVKIPSFSCTSNATSLTITGGPVAIRPATTTPTTNTIPQATDNGAASFYNTSAYLDTAGTIVFFRGAGGSTGWTNANSKGIAGVTGFTYLITG